LLVTQATDLSLRASMHFVTEYRQSAFKSDDKIEDRDRHRPRCHSLRWRDSNFRVGQL